MYGLELKMDTRPLQHELSRIHTICTENYGEFMSRVGLGNEVDLIWSREPLSGRGLWFEYHDGRRVFYLEAHVNSLKLVTLDCLQKLLRDLEAQRVDAEIKLAKNTQDIRAFIDGQSS